MTSSLRLSACDAWLPAIDLSPTQPAFVVSLGAIDPRSSVDAIGGVGVHLSTLDIVLAMLYLVGIVAIGLFAAWHHKKKQGAADEYFLAGNSLGWVSIGMALFATNISTLHLVSLAQNGFDTGLLNGNFEWMAGFTLVLLGLFFAPFYIRAGVSTLPDFLERRYNRICRDCLAFVSIVTAIVIHIAFALLTGGIILEELLEIPMMYSIVVLCILTGIYTIVGGLLAVVVTECIQTVVLLPGGFMMMAFTLFMICVAAQVVMSLVWPDPPQASVAGVPRGAELAWETPLAALKVGSGRGLSDPRVSSACLIAVMMILYWWFQ